jgi:hypothetical protein
MEMPPVMFFAMENIPPQQELTYHYNCVIGKYKTRMVRRRLNIATVVPLSAAACSTKCC